MLDNFEHYNKKLEYGNFHEKNKMSSTKTRERQTAVILIARIYRRIKTNYLRKNTQ